MTETRPSISRLLKALAPVALSLGMAGCLSTQQPQPPAAGWQSPLHREHALVGRIWDVRAGTFIDRDQLAGALRAPLILLGEKHDNPDHHRLQRDVLAHLQRRGELAAVSFEMLGSHQQALLDTLPADASEAQVREHLDWDDEGWSWEFYGPILMDLLRGGVPVRPANISESEMMAIYQGESDPGLAGVMNVEQMAQLNRDIDESHCGMLPASQFPPMVRVQQTRDLVMARSLQQDISGESGQRVLIAGNFHTRHDLGVPNYLDADDGSIVSLSFTEVDPASTDPVDYLREAVGGILPYDYLWFTPAVSSEDYCEGMRSGL